MRKWSTANANTYDIDFIFAEKRKVKVKKRDLIRSNFWEKMKEVPLNSPFSDNYWIKEGVFVKLSDKYIKENCDWRTEGRNEQYQCQKILTKDLNMLSYGIIKKHILEEE